MSITTINLGKLRVNWRGAWTTSTAYQINDAVSNAGSSYICVVANTSSSTFATDLGASYWQLMAQGNSANTTAGDITYYNSGANQRLPIGTQGQVLTVNSSGIPSWTAPSVTGLVYYVTPEGSDSNNGSSINTAFASVQKACQSVSGQAATIFVKSGTYYETLPITVPANVSIVGDGMRDTVITPKPISTVTATYSSNSTTTLNVTGATGTLQVGMSVSGTGFTGYPKIVTVVSQTQVILSAGPSTTPSGTLTFQFLSLDASPVANNLSTMFYMSDSTLLQGVLMTGMTGFTPASGGSATDITAATIGGVYLRLNPSTTITNKSPYVKDCTAKSAGGVGAIVDGLAESGGILSMVFWAYNIVVDGGVGIWAANGGKVEAVSCFTYYAYMGYTTSGGGQIRSLSGNNSYGTYGVVSEGYLASETPTTGSVYGNMITYSAATLTGTFTAAETITQPGTTTIATTGATSSGGVSTITFSTQGSAPYAVGQTIVVAGVTPAGFNGTKVVTACTTSSVSFSGSTAGPQTVAGTITAVASATVTSVQTGYIYFKQLYGTFNTTNTVTGSSSGATLTPSSVGGQANYLFVLSGLTAAPQVGASIQFTSDSNAYVIQATSGSYVNTSSVITVTLAQQKVTTSTDTTGVTIRYNFSLIRLQGHDFLSIGTGGVTTTNYPGIPTQSPNQANQIIQTFPGRVYYVSTDQSGNFSVGQYFSVNQATGAATLNANAFNLSGLTSLRLGSIGAQLGAAINEFSTDGTLSANSPYKVPTQSAIVTYLNNSYETFAPATDLAYDLGTPTRRWGHLYVGPGSITLGTLTITDASGTLQIQSSGSNAPVNINSINNGNSNVTVANNSNVTITANNTLALTIASSGVTVPGTLTVTGNLTVNGTTTTVNQQTINTSLVAAQGVNISGNYTGSYSDGILVDYVGGATGNGRISVGTQDQITFYNATDVSRFQLLQIGTTGNLLMTGGTLSSSASTVNVFNTTATTVNEYGVATSINVASSAGSATTWILGNSSYNNILSVYGNGTSGTATVTTNVTTGTANLFAGVTGTINIGQTGTTVLVGGIKPASTGKAIAMAMVFGG